MFSRKEITNSLFLDIESITEYKTFSEFSSKKGKLAKLFIEKMIKQSKLPETSTIQEMDDCYRKHASLYPEFSKILTISYGVVSFDQENNQYKRSIKNIISDDETEVLTRFANVVNKITEKLPEFKFCGHNIDGFDIPMIIKRMLINKINLPKKLQIHDLKPWESPTIDTMKIWRFGSFEPTSLDILCNALGLVSPKSNEVNNTVISEIYYSGDKDNLKTILEYCNKDVDAIIDIMLYFSELG